MRFFPSGRFLYKVGISVVFHNKFKFINDNFLYLIVTIFSRFLHCQNSSQKLKDVAKFMNFRSAKADSVFSGHYTFSDDKVRLCFFASV